MPRYTKDDVTIETSTPAEGVELRAQGFTEQAARTKDVKTADADKSK